MIAWFLSFVFVLGLGMTASVGYGLWRSDLPMGVRIVILVVMAAAIVRSFASDHPC
jgi:uncharacterized integral membrane protein